MSVRPSGRFMGARIAWRLSAWAIPIVVVPMICFTVGVLADDSRRTVGMDTYQAEHGLDRRAWGLWAGRRRGRFACRLGTPTSVEASAHEVPTWIPPAPTRGLQRFELSSSTMTTPWFRLRDGDRFGLFIAGSTVPDDQLSLEWGQVGTSGRLQALRTDAVAGIVSAATPWTFVGASELPKPAAGANAVRIVRNATNPPQAPLAVTAPVRYRQASLSGLLTEQGATALIHPALLLYFPCARQPALRAGIVDAPNYIVWYGDTYQPLLFAAASPFVGVRDVFPSNACHPAMGRVLSSG